MANRTPETGTLLKSIENKKAKMFQKVEKYN